MIGLTISDLAYQALQEPWEHTTPGGRYWPRANGTLNIRGRFLHDVDMTTPPRIQELSQAWPNIWVSMTPNANIYHHLYMTPIGPDGFNRRWWYYTTTVNNPFPKTQTHRRVDRQTFRLARPAPNTVGQLRPMPFQRLGVNGLAMGRPPRGTKEAKGKLQQTLAVLLRAWGTATEVQDFLEVLDQATGGSGRGSINDMLRRLFLDGNINNLDVVEFVELFVANEIEDRVVGTIHGLPSDKKFRRFLRNRPISVKFGNAL